MTEGLQTADGKPIEVQAAEQLDQAEREFHGAMAAPAADEPQHPGPPKKDPEAPFGYKKDGSGPRKRAPGPGRGKARVSAPTDPKSTESADVTAKRRTEGVKGLVQIGSAITATMYAQSYNKAWLADTFTITDNAEPFADAIVQTCEVNPAFAKAIDKVTNAGPYAALFGVSLTIGAQLAANHGIGVGRMLGGKSPDEVIAAHEVDDADPADRTA